MGRFRDPQDPLFQALNSSIAFDIRLAPFDLDQSIAHARMLARAGIVSEADRDAIVDGLERVREEIEAGSFAVAPDDEDVHMAIERRLTELIGPVGGKLHTARSRNDQVATDVALLVRAHAERARELIEALMGTLVELAERHLDWPLPGYTHLQRAQPVYLSHHLLAWFWKLRRDRERFGFCLDAADELPLGSGALAGANFDTDRAFVAEQLGFGSVSPNSLDAVSNRDYVLDYLGAAAICATHLSQLGGELVLWSTQEFGFVTMADAFSSGSSLMPQKKNPDAAELLRAKAPRVLGRLVTLHGALHGLPLTYNKDLQEDKEQLFDAIDTLELSLRVAREMLASASFDRERMAAAATDELIAATDAADLLVRPACPSARRTASSAGSCARRWSAASGCRSWTRTSCASSRPSSIRPRSPSCCEPAAWLESKVSEGGTSLARVREQLERARGVLETAGA